MNPEATSILLISLLHGKVLGSTRCNDHSQWGLIGGKRDTTDLDIQDCAIREYFEETGLRLLSGPRPVYERQDDPLPDGTIYNVTTFQVTNVRDIKAAEEAFQQPKEIEPGILVGFVDVMEILKGPFGKYNTGLMQRVLREYAGFRVTGLT